jgi:hypothetical protein
MLIASKATKNKTTTNKNFPKIEKAVRQNLGPMLSKNL